MSHESTMEQAISARELQITSELADLGRRLEDGDESELLVWVIPKKLACSQRSLRHHRLYGGSVRNLDPKAAPYVSEWADMVAVDGIQSIICLMSDTEVRFYKDLNLGADDLIAFYRSRFNVRHLYWEDPAHSKTPAHIIEAKKREVRRAALDAYDTLSKPVLIHCSAGRQRSAPVAAYIWWHRGQEGAA